MARKNTSMCLGATRVGDLPLSESVYYRAHARLPFDRPLHFATFGRGWHSQLTFIERIFMARSFFAHYNLDLNAPVIRYVYNV